MICRHLQILLIGLAAHHASIAAAPHRESGFLDRAVAVGGVEYRYEVYVPRDYDPGRAWPIVLALHGGGEYGSDGIRPTVGALAKAIRLHPDRFPAIVVFAQAHADGTPGWQLKSGEAALVEVDETLTEFHGDSSRIYLTGYSAGGNGAWFLAYHNPQRFAALIVIFHGDADQNVSVEESRRMASSLRAVGANVRYTELTGVDHAAWDQAYDDAEVVTWLLTQRRH